MYKIDSQNNQKIKWAKKIIFDSKHSKNSNLVAIESKRIFFDLIRLGNNNFVAIFVTENILKDERIKKILNQYAKITYIISEKNLKSLSHLKTSEGIVAIFKPKKYNFVLKKNVNYCGIVNLQNPHNLGAIVRSCLAFDIKCLFLIGDHPNVYHFECIRSSMGYIFEMPILCFSTFEQFYSFAKKNEIKLLATTNTSNATNLLQYHKKYNNCFLIGYEGNGLDNKIIIKCDEIIKINIKNVDSLNAAITASIIAFYLNSNNENN